MVYLIMLLEAHIIHTHHMQVQKVHFHLHVIIMSSPTERDG